MKIKIDYHSIGYGAHMFATPEFTNSEIVEAKSLTDKKLIEYIESKKDDYGNHFKYKKEPFMGFQFTSNQGGVKIREYIEPTVKKL